MLASPTPNPNSRIGRYEVLQKIATGGMAELFLAKQVGMEGFEKVVAIKRILAHLAHDEEFINMFRDEARIVAKLSHPNIVQIYDLGKSEDTYFIAMEYIPGRNLSSVAKRSRKVKEALPPAYIARCIAQACEGLHYAHTRREMDGKPLEIVHRDVSPQNIIVSFSGTVKLVDFGIAKAATKFAHTRAGVLKGKYAYMSPEQIRGENIDARSDVFAAGIVLYELLAGRRPFEKNNSIQTLKAIVQDPHLDCRQLNPDIPDELATIIHTALEKDVTRRYQSAQELQVALEDFIQGCEERVNNITISRWINRLFADELSKEQGGTVMLRGVGEVILPDVTDDGPQPSESRPKEDTGARKARADDFEPGPTIEAWGQASEDPQAAPLAQGLRGGGSVDPESRPPLIAPSNSMVGKRASLIEEKELSDDLYDGGFDEGETEFGFDPDPTAGANNGGDGNDEFGDTGELEPADSKAIEDSGRSTTGTAPVVQSEDVTWSPQGLEPEMESDGHDQWNEATVGYPGDVFHEEVLEGQDRAASWSGASLDAFAQAESGDGGQPWETSGGYPEDSEASLPDVDLLADSDDISSSVDFDFPDSVLAEDDGLEIDATIAQPGLPDEAERDVTMAQHNYPPGLLPDETSLPDATIAAGDALDDDMIARAAIEALVQELPRPEVLPENVEASFDDGATIAYSQSDEWASDNDIASLEDGTDFALSLEGGDATIAGLPGVPTGELEVAGFAESGGDQTVRAMDEEPSLPPGVAVEEAEDFDVRTIAGATHDYVSAGVRPEEEPYDVEVDSTIEAPADAVLGAPRRRGQEALGAIQLSKRTISKGDLAVPGSSDIDEVDFVAFASGPATADHSASAPDTGDFELGLDEDGEIPAMPPGPMLPVDQQPQSARDAYSELVAPVMPSELGPPPGEESDDLESEFGVGSGNVPPAHMSLSQVLQNPDAARPSSLAFAPARSASLVGRQIREVVRTGETRPASLPPQSSLDPPTLPLLAGVPESAGSLPLPAPAEPAQSKRVVVLAAIIAVVAVVGVGLYLLAPKLFGPLERLDVRSSPPGAHVLINGTPQARLTPLSISGLVPAKAYTVRVELEGYEAAQEEITLKKDQQLIYAPRLNALGKVVP